MCVKRDYIGLQAHRNLHQCRYHEHSTSGTTCSTIHHIYTDQQVFSRIEYRQVQEPSSEGILSLPAIGLHKRTWHVTLTYGYQDVLAAPSAGSYAQAMSAQPHDLCPTVSTQDWHTFLASRSPTSGQGQCQIAGSLSSLARSSKRCNASDTAVLPTAMTVEAARHDLLARVCSRHA